MTGSITESFKNTLCVFAGLPAASRPRAPRLASPRASAMRARQEP